MSLRRRTSVALISTSMLALLVGFIASTPGEAEHAADVCCTEAYATAADSSPTTSMIVTTSTKVTTSVTTTETTTTTTVTEPITEPVTQPPETEPVTQPPETEPVTEPPTTEPVTEPPVIQQPTPEVDPNASESHLGTYQATWYTAVDMGYSAPPNGASGRELITGYSIASNSLAFGTLVRIEGGGLDGIYRVDDCGGMPNNVIDVYYYDRSSIPQSFKSAGRVNIEVYILQ